jgi:hypothetical protein
MDWDPFLKRRRGLGAKLCQCTDAPHPLKLKSTMFMLHRG